MSARIDELLLDAIGREVVRISFDRQTRLLLDGDWEIILAGLTTWIGADGRSVEFDAESPQSVALELIGLLDAQVTDLQIEDSVLTAVFGTRRLSTGADEQYENWEVDGPDGIMIIARPGGDREPAVWGRRDENPGTDQLTTPHQ